MLDGHSRFTLSLRFLLCVGALQASMESGVAQQWMPKSDEQSLLLHVSQRVRQCQLKDGGITRHSYGEPNIPADIDPWTGNQTILWLLQAQKQVPDPRISLMLLPWLRWCAEHQRANEGEGEIYFRRLHGTLSSNNELENTTYQRCDSDAAAAASYLLAVDRVVYFMSLRSLEPKLQKACVHSLDILKKCRQGELSCSFPPDAVPSGRTLSRSFLVQVEAYQGFAAAQRLFGRLGDMPRSQQAGEMAAALAAKLPRFWNGEEVYFQADASLTDSPEDANRTWGACPLHADAQHNLMALALFDRFPNSNRARLWKKLKVHCGDEFENLLEHAAASKSPPPLDWVCLAAYRVTAKPELDRLLALYRLHADAVIRSSYQSPRPAADPQNEQQVAEYARLRSERLPSVDRIAFISHVIACQNIRGRDMLPTIDFPWPAPPLPEVGTAAPKQVPTSRAAKPDAPPTPKKF